MSGNILVVDDDKEIVQAIAINLEQEGFRVFKAYDGLEALEIAMSQDLSADYYRRDDAEAGRFVGGAEDSGTKKLPDHDSVRQKRGYR